MIKKLLQTLAFFLPSPFNIWLHKLAGSKIGKYVIIHPLVLILAKKVRIDNGAKIKLGTMINVRSFHLGRKSSIGYFTLVNGESDLHIGDACLIGTRTTIQCSRALILEHYAGVGPHSILSTHGSFLPAIEGYPAKFAPITIKNKAWLCMNTTVGPGVTVGENSIVLPGTVLSRNVSPNSLVTGDPASLKSVPIFPILQKPDNIELFAIDLLKDFCNWSNEYKGTNWRVVQNVMTVHFKRKHYTVSVNDDADIVFYTEKGKKRHKMYFNLADFTTDESRHPLKTEIEEFMRLYYGLIFL